MYVCISMYVCIWVEWSVGRASLGRRNTEANEFVGKESVVLLGGSFLVNSWAVSLSFVVFWLVPFFISWSYHQTTTHSLLSFHIYIYGVDSERRVPTTARTHNAQPEKDRHTK